MSSTLLVVALAPGLHPTAPPLLRLAGVAAPSAVAGGAAGDVGGTAQVSIASGETPATIVAHWDPGGADGPAAVDLYDAAGAGPAAAPPLLSVPVAPGLTGVGLPGLDASRAYLAMVTVTGPGGPRRLGPSVAFSPGPDGPVLAAPAGADGSTSTVAVRPPAPAPASGRPAAPAAVTAPAIATAPALSSVHADSGPSCSGAGYGPGAVSVDGYSGFQGSYCIPPGFAGGTGAFCVDHGLDYPSGSYRWASTTVGEGVALVNQYDRVANPADVARLGWVIATSGATADPARAVAVGVIAHAVMGDYPGLSTASLDPPQLSVQGGDPAAIAADVGAMWAASGAGGGPYQVLVSVDPGPYITGKTYRGSVQVVGRGGGPEPSVAMDFSASQGASVIANTPTVTGPAGTLGFDFTPSAPAFTLAAATSTTLPGDTLTLWSAQRPPVAVQRVVNGGAGLRPSGSLPLAASLPAQATMVKVSTDPLAVPVSAGFGFDVAVPGPGGTWTPVAHRDSAADGTLTAVTDLAPGPYRVTETAHPPAFEPGGPWDFTLTAGQQGRWELDDAPVTQPLTVTKVGDDQAVLPIGAGVGFAISFDASGNGTFATPVATVTTGSNATTPPLAVAPGRYRIAETTPPAGYQPAAAITVNVPPVGAAGPQAQTAKVDDVAVPGILRLVKTDAATGLGLAGAQLRVDRLSVDGSVAAVDTLTSTSTPLDVPGLEPARYVVTESRPPDGYELSAAPQTVDLQPGQTLEVTIADRAVPAASTPTTPPTVSPPTTPAPTAPAPSPAKAPAPATPVATPAPPTTSPPAPAVNSPAPALAPAPASAPRAPAAALAFTGLPLWRLLLASAGTTGAGLSLVRLARPRARRRGAS